jgi:hypothetical protein
MTTGILEMDRLIDPFEGNLGHLVHPLHEVPAGRLEYAYASAECWGKRAPQVADGIASQREPPGAFRKGPMGSGQVLKAQFGQPALDDEDRHEPPFLSARTALGVRGLGLVTSCIVAPAGRGDIGRNP